MYKLNRTLDFSFLIGKELLQVCVGVVQVILRFDEQVSISIESDFIIIDENQNEFYCLDIPSDTGHLIKFLGLKIQHVEVLEFDKLGIYFSNGCAIFLMDNNEFSESFQIISIDDEIIV